MKAEGIQLIRYDELSPHIIAMRLIKPGSRVLSAGCGIGREVEFLDKELKCKVIAIDNDEKYLRESKKRNPKVVHKLANMSEYSEKESYDYVVCLWNTINYSIKLEKKKKFIKRAYENLKPGGKLIITSSDIFSHWRAIFHNIKYREMYFYFPSQVSKWFKDSGFAVEKIKIGKRNLTQLIVASKPVKN